MSRAAAARRGAAWPLPALLAVVTLAYLPSLDNGLVWDDISHIADNPRIASLSGTLHYFAMPEGPYHRPALFLSYWLDARLWGIAPFGLHLTNLLLHLLNTALVVVVARRSGVAEGAALVGAALFALHPLQVEAVAYVSGRTDLLMTAGALSSWLLLRGRGPALWRGVGSAAAGCLAMLCKETGFALVVLWPWLAWRHERGWRDRLAAAGPGLMATILLVALRPGALPIEAWRRGLTLRFVAVGQGVLTYAGVLLWPFDLQVDRLTLLPTTRLAAGLALAALAGLAALVAAGVRRRGALADWTVWSAAFFLPVANVVPLYPAIAEHAIFTPEHNLYAPLAGIGVLVGVAGEWLWRRMPSRRAVAGETTLAIVGVVVFAACALITTHRLADWRDEERLFGSAVARGSASPRVWYDYGNDLLRRGATVEAARALEGAARRGPDDAQIWMNLGVVRQRLGAFEAAESAYLRAAALAPNDAQIEENLGTLYLWRGNRDAARAAFRRSLELDPSRPTARRALDAIEAAAPR